MQVAQDTGNTSADLSVTGNASPDPASATGTIMFDFTVGNAGPDPAEDTTFESEFAPGLNLDSMAASNGGSCIADVFTMSCDLGTIDPGAANEVHVTIGVVAPEVGADKQFEHHASVEATTPDPDGSNNEVTVTSTVLARRSDLSIQKHGPQEVASGEPFSYTIDVANAGPGPADHVTVTDVLPAGVSFTDSTPNGACSFALGTVTCDLGTLAPGGSASVELHVVADVPPGDPVVVVNTATVGSDRIDLDPANDVSEAVSTTVVPAVVVETADVAVTSVLNVPNPVTGGYDLGSTATVTNLGPGDANDVTLTDTLAPGETFVAGGSDPSCTATGGVVTCALGDMPNGDVATVLIITKTPAGGRRHDDPRRLHGDDGRRRHPRQRLARRGDRGPCAPRRLRGRLRPAVGLDHVAERRHAVEPRPPGRDQRRSDGGARRHPRRRPRWPGRGHRACLRCPVRVHVAPSDVRTVLPHAGSVREPGPRERPERLRGVQPDHGRLPRQLVGARIGLGPVRHEVPVRLERCAEDAPLVRWLEAHGPALRRIPGAVVRMVERVLVRGPPNRGAVHERWNVRPQPVGRGR